MKIWKTTGIELLNRPVLYCIYQTHTVAQLLLFYRLC
jgi:hypothetical protein